MKKMLILSAVAILAASSLGCCKNRTRNWWHRGAVCTPPVISNVEGCTTGCDSCDDTGGYIGGYAGDAGCTTCDSGMSTTTYDSGPGFTEMESSRPAVAPEPGNDT